MDLPKYSKKGDYDPELADLESAPLVSSRDIPPPRPASTGAGRSGEYRLNVTYIYDNKWPIKGKDDKVVGVLGRDKEETIQIVQRAFPFLNQYDESRIIFETHQLPVPSIGDGTSYPPSGHNNGGGGGGGGGGGVHHPNNTTYYRVLDEAWPQFKYHPPQIFQVTVQLTKDEERRRKWRFGLIIGGVCASLLLPILVAAMYSILSDN